MAAANLGNIEAAQLLLDWGATINARNQLGKTALDIAAGNDKWRVYELLRSYYAMTAAELGMQSPVAQLKTPSAPPRATGTGSKYAPLAVKEIDDAARDGDVAKITALLKSNPDLVFSRDSDGDTPLIWAAVKDHWGAVKVLLAYGADVNARNKEGMTPLLYAAMSRYPEAVAFLLVNKAEVNVKNHDGFTPLHEMASGGRRDMVELLLASNADVNAKTKDGDTPLHSAMRYEREQVLGSLLAGGANVNARDNDGLTPLHTAVAVQQGHRQGDEKAMEWLLAHGADVNAKTNKAMTPLHYAALNGWYAAAQLLLDHGADVNARNNKGSTPLRMADENYHPEIVKLLLANNANPRAVGTAAVPKILYPAQVFLSKGTGRFQWTTTFKEVGGKAGYRVSSRGQIVDPLGQRWANPGGNDIRRGEVVVPAGGNGSDAYWVSGDFCGGHANFYWSGHDVSGNPIELRESVDLKCEPKKPTH